MDYRLQRLGQSPCGCTHGRSALRFYSSSQKPGRKTHTSTSKVQICTPAAPGCRCLRVLHPSGFHAVFRSRSRSIHHLVWRSTPVPVRWLTGRTLPLIFACKILYRHLYRRHRPLYSREIKHVPALPSQRLDHHTRRLTIRRFQC